MATLTVTEKPAPNRSRCFICDQLIIISLSNHNQNDFDNLKRKSKVCEIFASLICRFLHFNAYSATTTNILKPGKTLNIHNNNSTLVRLSTQQLKICDGCFPNVEIFCDIYAYWKHLKLELIDKVKEMATLMRKIKLKPKPLHAKVNQNGNSKTEAFRKRFLLQVDKMIIKDYPQLKLKKLADIDEVEKDDDLFVPVVVKKRPQPQQSRKSSITVIDLTEQNATASNSGNGDLYLDRDLGQSEDASVMKTPSISNERSLLLPIKPNLNLKRRSRKKLYYTDRKNPVPKMSTIKTKTKETSEDSTSFSIANAKVQQQQRDRFKCRLCEKRFNTWKSCQIHLGKVHKDKNVLSFDCGFCSKTFKYNSDLKKHERIHTGEKPYRCDLCWRHFTQRSQLNKHLLNFHGVGKNEVKRLIEKDRERIAAEQETNQPENASHHNPIENEDADPTPSTSILATTPGHHNGDLSLSMLTPHIQPEVSSGIGENNGNFHLHDQYDHDDADLPFRPKIEFVCGADNNDNYNGHNNGNGEFGDIVTETGVTGLHDHQDANASFILPTIDTNCNGFVEEEMDFDGFINST